MLPLYRGTYRARVVETSAESIAMVDMMLLMIKARKSMKLAIPFGPFLAIGGTAYILFGPQLITWYFNLLRPS